MCDARQEYFEAAWLARAALQAQHDWHLKNKELCAEYEDSSLCELTVNAISKLDCIMKLNVSSTTESK